MPQETSLAVGVCLLTVLVTMAAGRLLGGTWLWPLYALLRLPSTLLHELAHFLVGWLLFAKPTRISLWPQHNGTALQFGHVAFSHLRWYNAAPVYLAPLINAYVAYRLLIQTPFSFDGAWVVGWLAGCLVQGGMPSGSDWAGAGRSLMAWAVLALAGWLFLGGRFGPL